jgi:hypothetical protein
MHVEAMTRVVLVAREFEQCLAGLGLIGLHLNIFLETWTCSTTATFQRATIPSLCLASVRVFPRRHHMNCVISFPFLSLFCFNLF